MVRLACRAALEKGALDTVVIEVGVRTVIADYFLITSGSSERNVSAIVRGVEEAMYKAGAKKAKPEGLEALRWVLLDFSGVMVHIFHSEDRHFFALDRLWGDCPRLDVSI